MMVVFVGGEGGGLLTSHAFILAGRRKGVL